MAFSFRGMPLIQGVCPGCDYLINNGCSLEPRSSSMMLEKKIKGFSFIINQNYAIKILAVKDIFPYGPIAFQ